MRILRPFCMRCGVRLRLPCGSVRTPCRRGGPSPSSPCIHFGASSRFMSRSRAAGPAQQLRARPAGSGRRARGSGRGPARSRPSPRRRAGCAQSRQPLHGKGPRGHFSPRNSGPGGCGDVVGHGANGTGGLPAEVVLDAPAALHRPIEKSRCSGNRKPPFRPNEAGACGLRRPPLSHPRVYKPLMGSACPGRESDGRGMDGKQEDEDAEDPRHHPPAGGHAVERAADPPCVEGLAPGGGQDPGSVSRQRLEQGDRRGDERRGTGPGSVAQGPPTATSRRSTGPSEIWSRGWLGRRMAKRRCFHL